MTRILALIFLASMAFAEDTVIPLGLGDIPAVPSPTVISTLLAASTTLNATSPTYTLITGAYNPATDSIVTPDVRRQRNQVIGATTYAMDLIEGTRTNILTAGTGGRFDFWTAAAGLTVTADTIAAPDGEVIGQTLTDPGASLSSAEQTFTVANDSLMHWFSIYVLKTTGGTAPTFGVTLALTGGTPVTTNARINTDLGTQQYGSNANTVIEIPANTLWYRALVGITNNTSGNTTLTLDVYPAAAAYGASVDDAAATGISKCAFSDLEKATFPSSFISNRNLLFQTQTLGDASWGKTRSTVTTNTTANPIDAAVNAETINEDNTGTSTHSISQTATKAASSLQYTFSTYLKQSGRTWAFVECTDSAVTNGAGMYFDVANGVKGTAVALGAGWTLNSSNITAVGSWYRCDVTVTTSTATSIRSNVFTATADLGVTIVTPLNAAALICWGMQLEYGAKANTYWATTTIIGRRGDGLLTSTGAISTTQGTLISVFRPYGWTGNPGATIYRLLETTGTSTDCVLRSSTSANNVQTVLRSDATGTRGVSNITGTTTNGVNSLLGMTWTTTPVAVNGFFNGAAAGTSQLDGIPPYNAVSALAIGSTVTPTLSAYSYVLGLYWPTALTDSSMQVLSNATAP